jgi:glutamine synthetase
MDKFTWGIGTRNTSVRIPNATHKNGCGYFEDRRPAANIDPYLATSIIAKTCCLDSL